MSAGRSSQGDNRAGLYPIVRRARRPLIIQDDDAVAAPAVAEAGLVVPLVAAEQPVSYSRPAGRAERKPNRSNNAR
jgi:hypothetical protein